MSITISTVPQCDHGTGMFVDCWFCDRLAFETRRARAVLARLYGDQDRVQCGKPATHRTEYLGTTVCAAHAGVGAAEFGPYTLEDCLRNGPIACKAMVRNGVQERVLDLCSTAVGHLATADPPVHHRHWTTLENAYRHAIGKEL